MTHSYERVPRLCSRPHLFIALTWKQWSTWGFFCCHYGRYSAADTARLCLVPTASLAYPSSAGERPPILYHLLKAEFHPRVSEQELKLVSETIIHHFSHIVSDLVFRLFAVTVSRFVRSHPVCVSLPLHALLDGAIKWRNACRFRAVWSIRVWNRSERTVCQHRWLQRSRSLRYSGAT